MSDMGFTAHQHKKAISRRVLSLYLLLIYFVFPLD